VRNSTAGGHGTSGAADELHDHAVRVSQEQHDHAAEPGAGKLDELRGR
jgi:hypothetical protein